MRRFKTCLKVKFKFKKNDFKLKKIESTSPFFKEEIDFNRGFLKNFSSVENTEC
jgi:hypothetical protein